MKEDEFRLEKQAEITALAAEFSRELERVCVDLRAAIPRLEGTDAPLERQVSDDDFEVTLTINVSRIVETLRRLPDSAGTEVFVAAYNARWSDS
jgi:hypothetical protein